MKGKINKEEQHLSNKIQNSTKNENKDQQGKVTFTERSPRHNPVTPARQLEGIEVTKYHRQGTQKGNKQKVGYKICERKGLIKNKDLKDRGNVHRTQPHDTSKKGTQKAPNKNLDRVYIIIIAHLCMFTG
jgi:hypothetical protein